MNQVYPYSIHEPIADHQRPGDIFWQAKNLVAQGYSDSYLDKLRPGAFFLLTTHLEGPLINK